VTTPLVPLHVAAHRESLATSWLWALVRFLARVAMAVNTKATRTREGLVAGGADVAILRLRVRRLARLANVVVMLPGVLSIRSWRRYSHGHVRLKVGRKRSLRIHGHGAISVRIWRIEGSSWWSAWGGSVGRLSVCWCAVRRHGRGSWY
jgi:hypothetical protein